MQLCVEWARYHCGVIFNMSGRSYYYNTHVALMRTCILNALYTQRFMCIVIALYACIYNIHMRVYTACWKLLLIHVHACKCICTCTYVIHYVIVGGHALYYC